LTANIAIAAIVSKDRDMKNRAIVVADTSGKIQLWSEGAERLFGHSSREAVGQSLDLIVPDEYRGPHWEGFRRAMSSGAAKMEAQPFDLPIACRQGAAVAHGTFVLLRDAHKAVIGAMAIFDVAEPPA
jgi:PAS domain S-box-containing protein